MGARRMHSDGRAVALLVDGERVAAVEGEPVAVALAAAGRSVLSRSVKYHRPRGAACYRGRCEGCLMRVDGVPNVATCQVPAREGMVVQTQNVVGSAERDLLSVTDWFFPGGMDHHHMFTRFKALNQVMQKVARRIAGIGELPDEARAVVPSPIVEVDVLVVGAGIAGLTAAAQLAKARARAPGPGRRPRVVLVEEAGAPGGDLAIFPGEVDTPQGRVSARPLAEAHAAMAHEAGVELLFGHAAVGVFEREVLVSRPGALVRYRPRRLVVATGVHEGPAALPGNDLPNVLGPRAACILLTRGVLPGERVCLVGSSPFGDALAVALAAAGAEVHGPFPLDRVRALGGRLEVDHAIVTDREGAQARIACDAVVAMAEVSGVYELGAQAGARVRFDGASFFLEADERGATASAWVRAVGSCTGVMGAPAAVAQARAAAQDLLSELGEGA